MVSTLEHKDKITQDSEQSSKKAVLVPPYIFGASVIGPLHIQKNILCQDACAYEFSPFGWGAIAVADGLGSASKSEIGAKTAVGAAIQAIKAIIEGKMKEEINLHDTAREAVNFARKELEEKAIEEQCNLRDLATTLIVVIILENNIAVAHIGDGAVVAKKDEGLILVSGPGESEYVNEVVPLTSKGWEEFLKIIPRVSDIEYVAVFTDGCQRAALRKIQNDLEPYNRFFAPLFSYAKELDDLSMGEQDIRDLLASQKISEHSEDDKTLVISVLKNRSGSGDKPHCLRP